MSDKCRKLQRDASYLLPDHGGEVVRELLDEIAALEEMYSELYAHHIAEKHEGELAETEQLQADCRGDGGNGVTGSWDTWVQWTQS